MSQKQYPEVVYWLTLIQESGLKLNLIKPIIQRWSVAGQRPLSEIFSLSALEWNTVFGLSDAQVEQVMACREKLASQVDLLTRWKEKGIEVLICTDPRYPKQLLHTLPQIQQPLLLWAEGAIHLLDEPLVATLGNQTPDAAISQFLQSLMETITAENIHLISGYGRGLDRAAFEVMMAQLGGRAIVMLPMGLTAFHHTSSALDGAVKEKRIALVSPFAPEVDFHEKFSEARNLLIDHLAVTLLILYPDDEAQDRAKAALQRGLSVFIKMEDSAGNRALIEQGALLLTDPGEVIEMVQQALIDTALWESGEEDSSSTVPIPPAPSSSDKDEDEDYSLNIEEVEPIEAEEALEILSIGGEIPDILRQRLEKKQQQEE